MTSTTPTTYSMENNSKLENQPSYLIVIPAYNEEDNIREVVLGAKQYADVCVIDDCSQDRTPSILQEIEDIHIIHHEINTHIPGALLDGMRYAVQQGYDYCITMDAGLSHAPHEIPRFINHPHSDLAIGVRQQKRNTPFHRKLLSRMANPIYNLCLDLPPAIFRHRYYRDIPSGFRRYSYEAMDFLLSRQIKSRSFGVLFETTMLIYRGEFTISEVPITYTFSKSSLNASAVRDCLSICFHAGLHPGAGRKQ